MRFIAGGTNLLDLMKLNVEQSAGDHRYQRTAARQDRTLARTVGLRIGALVRNSDLAHDPTVMRDYAVLSQALLSGASPQLRNMATTGGNLVAANPLHLFSQYCSRL